LSDAFGGVAYLDELFLSANRASSSFCCCSYRSPFGCVAYLDALFSFREPRTVELLLQLSVAARRRCVPGRTFPFREPHTVELLPQLSDAVGARCVP
jgi:hypothetical protein